jgi:hypothetical protein
MLFGATLIEYCMESIFSILDASEALKIDLFKF